MDESFCMVPFNRSNLTAIPIQDPAILAWSYLTGALCMIGIVTNLTVLSVVCASPQLRKGAGIFIEHLLFCHLALCLIAFPMIISRVYETTITATTNIPSCSSCRYQHILHVLLNNLVNWSDGMLAVNRLVAIYYPSKFRTFNRRPVHYVCIVLCWLCTLAYSFPPLFGHLAQYKMSPLGTCGFTNGTRTFVVIMYLDTFSPIVLAVWAGWVIIRRGRTRNQVATMRRCIQRDLPLYGRPSLPSINTNSFNERQKRTSKMLVTSFAFTLACQLPQYVTMLTNHSSRHPRMAVWFWCLAVVQFAATPIIFVVMNHDYQRLTMDLLKRLRGGSGSMARPVTPTKTAAPNKF
ncbi:hypothetical protein BV898_00476 [Hypsibius exemplaris]|uniref:G-protein coupled receptors family 1 profile domain-containing protein n=1 Tax=Hypsibius exemplaris TaxID=2072580 RepID=A0A1W0XDI6_HYPEX|nr:hypothetical protein BV898_00476 [Hypsibius exemplaris]